MYVVSRRSIWTRPEPGERRPRHTREQIAAAAMRIADAEGFGAVTMRRVAAELDAGTMTLYHYVRTKDELLSLIDDTIMGELLIPAGEVPDDWRAALAEIARRTRAAYLRHPWAIGTAGTGGPGPNAMRHAEQSMAVMASLDVDAMTRFEIVSQIDDYVAGFVQRNGGSDLEGEIESLPEERFDYFEAQLATGAFPHLVELTGGDLRAFGRRFVELAQDEDRFERGLARLLDGIARFVAEQTGGGGRQS